MLLGPSAWESEYEQAFTLQLELAESSYLASEFDAEVTVTRDGQTVDARSIMGLMMLGAGPGSVLELKAEGEEADAALDALVGLIRSRFDEDA